MSYSNITTELQEGNLLITINRPEKLNAINRETIAELGQAFTEGDENAEVKVIIITGAGDKAFIAGADISEFAHFSVEEGKMLADKGQKELFDVVANLSTPVIAAINGYALGGGLELALACHVRIGSESAKMGLPEVSLGVIPGYGGTQRLSQLIGKGKAMELILTAGMMGAEDAYRYGLLNQVVTADELLISAKALANKMKKNSPRAQSAAIKCINAAYEDGVNGFEVEIAEFGACFGSEDFKEGTTAFLEKRKANFSGN